MAARVNLTLNCSRCKMIILEYVELYCTHVLCTYCTRTLTEDKKITCVVKKCKRITKPIPASKKIFDETIKVVMSQYQATMEKKQKVCLREVTKLEKSVKNLRDEQDKQMELLSSMFDGRVKELENHYDGLRRNTADSFHKREVQLEKILTDIKNILTQIHDELKKVNSPPITKGAKQTADSERQQIEDLERKTTECASQTIEVDIPDLEVRIENGGELGLSDSVTISGSPPQLHISAPQPAAMSQGMTIEGEMPDLEVRVEEEREQGLSGSVTISGSPPQRRTSAPPPAAMSQVDVEWVSGRQWVRQEHSVKLPAWPYCLRLVRGQLLQCHRAGITVLDAELQHLRDIDQGKMRGVYDVAGLPDGRLAVATENGLYEMDEHGRERRRIDEGWFTGVVEHAGSLYAAHRGTGSIRVYGEEGGWTRRHTIDLQCGGQQRICLSITDSVLYACLCNDDTLVAYSLAGERLGSWGEGGEEEGQLCGPFLCMTGAGGAALIADSCNDRLQTLSARRQWRVVPLQQPVSTPGSALLLRHRLIVTSRGDKTLYVYE